MIEQLAKALVLSVQHISKRYRTAKHAAVTDISLALRNNHVTALLGPNGSGKTTTMYRNLRS